MTNLKIGDKVVNKVDGRILAIAQVVGIWPHDGGQMILKELKNGKPRGGKWVAPVRNLAPLEGADLSSLQAWQIKYALGDSAL